MEKWRDYAGYSLIAITGVLVLCTVFERDHSLVNGLVMGKFFWAEGMIPFFCLAVLIAVLLKGGSRFSISIADLAFLAFVGITHLFYDRALDPEPEKLLFEGQLLFLWFALRVALSAYPTLKSFFLIMLLCIGAAEAVTGLQQLYGLQASNHHLFRLTGSFFNPGPYSGFLAILLPVALALALKTGKLAERRRGYAYRICVYFPWLVIALLVIVLPAGMSRTAWVAALIASTWVYWVQEIGIEKTKSWISKHKKVAVASSILALIFLFALATGVFLLKKDSANGRLLLWKITTRIIGEQPFTGVGVGGFPAAYADQQAAYFASANYSETEALVAGAPEYAFNEFIQIGAERGVLGLLLFFGFISFVVYSGCKNRLYGIVGGIIAFCVFSLASYPLQLPEFPIVFLFLAAMAITGKEKRKSINSLYLLIPVFILSAMNSHLRQDDKTYYQQWNKAQHLYNNKAYEVALSSYEELYPYLKQKPGFLFEMGQSLSKTNDYDRAITTLTRASRLSADPMIHYMIARNEQFRGNYKEAERILIHAIHILPERIYPYYLLVLLYSDSKFYDPEKLRAAANAVLTKEPKVLSTAVQEMRKETKTIISDRV